jgi:hypothetical protein
MPHCVGDDTLQAAAVVTVFTGTGAGGVSAAAKATLLDTVCNPMVAEHSAGHGTAPHHSVYRGRC